MLEKHQIVKLSEDTVEDMNDIPTNDNENNLIDLIDLSKGEKENTVILPNSVQD